MFVGILVAVFFGFGLWPFLLFETADVLADGDGLGSAARITAVQPKIATNSRISLFIGRALREANKISREKQHPSKNPESGVKIFATIFPNREWTRMNRFNSRPLAVLFRRLRLRLCAAGKSAA